MRIPLPQEESSRSSSSKLLLQRIERLGDVKCKGIYDQREKEETRCYVSRMFREVVESKDGRFVVLVKSRDTKLRSSTRNVL